MNHDTLRVDEGRNGHEVELFTDQILEIRLPENPTTGFRWSLVSSGGPACTLVRDYFEALGNTPGREGSHHWRFKAAQSGEASIKLIYQRSWEQNGVPTRTFALHVRVRQ
jgi:inhibitor of cysteine peptidase